MVLARDGSLANYLVSLESGRGPFYGEKGPFLEHMEYILAFNIEGSELRDISDDDLIEIVNGPSFIDDPGPCGCCQGQRLWRRVSDN